jgi:hypothetical protein
MLQHPFSSPLSDVHMAHILAYLPFNDILKIRLLSRLSWEWVEMAKEMRAYWRAHYARMIGSPCEADRPPCRTLLRKISSQLFRSKVPTRRTIRRETRRLASLQQRLRDLRQKVAASKKKLNKYRCRERAEPFRSAYRERICAEDEMERRKRKRMRKT